MALLLPQMIYILNTFRPRFNQHNKKCFWNKLPTVALIIFIIIYICVIFHIDLPALNGFVY